MAAQFSFTKRTALARAQVVNGAGDQLLASAGFSENQYRGIRGCHLFYLCEHCPETGAAPNDVFNFVSRAILLNFSGGVELSHGVTFCWCDELKLVKHRDEPHMACQLRPAWVP